MTILRRFFAATRASPLALAQTEIVLAMVRKNRSDVKISALPIKSRGDEITDRPLADIGGKELFVRNLEAALVEGRADFAVHSLKDMASEISPSFMIAAIPPREDARDAFVSVKFSSPEEMPTGAIVGTSAPRRMAQIRRYFPHWKIALARGNVQTRLARLDAGEFDALILAAAGLIRLGLESRISAMLSVGEFIPAIGQGALAAECIAGRSDIAELLSPINHDETARCVRAERAFAAALHGDCSTPMAAYTVCEGESHLRMRAMLASPDGDKIAFASAEGESPEEIGNAAAMEILSADKSLLPDRKSSH